MFCSANQLTAFHVMATLAFNELTSQECYIVSYYHSAPFNYNVTRSTTSEGSQPAITCAKLTTETLEQGVKYVESCSDVFIVNSEHISHLVLVFLELTLSKRIPAGLV